MDRPDQQMVEGLGGSHRGFDSLSIRDALKVARQ